MVFFRSTRPTPTVTVRIRKVRWPASLRKIRPTSAYHPIFHDSVEDTMSIIGKTHPRSTTGHALRTILLCALVTGVAYGQAQPSRPEKLAYAADLANVPDA